MENNHQKKLNQIEADCSEIKRQILQLEFQHKKDMVDYKKESELRNRQIERHLRHLSKLAGITFEELDAMDDRLTSAAEPLSRSRKR